MKKGLIFLIAIILANTADANWDDAFKNKKSSSERKGENKKRKENTDLHTDGLNVDITEKVKTSSKGEWFESLQSDSETMQNSDEPEMLKKLVEALKAIETIMPDNMPEKGIALNQIAQGFYTLGDYERGEQLSLRALRITEKFKGENSIETFYCLRTMALMYESIGEYDRSKKIINNCFAIIEKNKKIDRGFIPALYANLSKFNLALNEIDEADINANSALEIAISRPDEVGLDLALLAKANCEKFKGNYIEAQNLYIKAINVIEKQYKQQQKSGKSEQGNGSLLAYAKLSLLELYNAQGLVDKSLSILEETELIFKKEFLEVMTTDSARFLAAKIILADLEKKEDKAKKLAQEFIEYQNKTLPSALEMVENQRLSWQKQNLSLSIPVSFSTPDIIANCILSWKGIVLDSLISDIKNIKISGNAQDNKLINELVSLKKQLTQIKFNNSQQKDLNYIKYIENKIYAKEMQISKASKSRYSSKSIPNLKSIQDSLSPDDSLLEYVSYRDVPDIYLGPKKIGLIAIFKNLPPMWFDLGDEKIIFQQIKNFQSLMASSQTTDAEIEASLKELYKKLIPKETDGFPATVNNLFISPDGILNFLPFGCLLQEDNRFLAESKKVFYLGSGRDLLKESPQITSKKISIFSNPTFYLDSKTAISKLPSNSTQSDPRFSLSLPPLPGTEFEAQQLEKIARTNGWDVNMNMGISATEELVANSKTPTILHLATHGFFLGNKADHSYKSGDRGMSVKKLTDSEIQAKSMLFELNPMQSSGIALAGAQNTFTMWSSGQAPEPSGDGVLTAEEVAALDLSGTLLVTLSACESGLGEAQAGEGVFGLRRSFMMAGAKNLLITLWPVDDNTTAKLMVDFYNEFFTSMNPSLSLAKIQTDWLLNLRQKNGTIDAVRKAGPFVMATTGRPDLN
jgi:CHAT domain-containing protein